MVSSRQMQQKLERIAKKHKLELKGNTIKYKKLDKKRFKVKNPAKSSYNPEERYYFSTRGFKLQNKIAQVESDLLQLDENPMPQRFKIILAKMDIKTKSVVLQKYQAMLEMNASSDEYHKTKNLIDAICRIPLGIYKPLPITYKSSRDDIRNFLKTTRKNLDQKIYGHHEAKDYIVRLLAQWIVNPNSKGLVLGIQGDAGVGKTTLVKEGISKALDLPFAFIPLGGASESMYLEGLTYSYSGSTWGKIIDVIMRAGCMNPVIVFDELDKVSTTSKGQEVINILMHLTDATQNDRYHDKYFTDLEFDLSRCIFIFTYNDENLINPILKDRLIKINTKGYQTKDKVVIAQDYMIPEILKEFNMTANAIKFNDAALEKIINIVDEEQGVRNLRRALHLIVSNHNYNQLMNEDVSQQDIEAEIIEESQLHKYDIASCNKKQKHVHMMYT